MKGLNREILRLAIPSILANITVPLVGMVDTFVAGHIQGGAGAAAFIGGISVGSTLFSLLYWNFGFLRVGTGGLTAPAFGRGDSRDCALILSRGVGLARGIAILTLALQIPFLWLAFKLVDCSDAVRELATGYFFIRIWAAPATLSLMAFRGWFVGMQDSMSSMWTDLIVNVTNIAASVLLTFGVAGWEGLGFDGIAAGTLVAQYTGLLWAILVCTIKYRSTFESVTRDDARELLKPGSLLPFLKMNGHLLGRSLCFTAIYMGYTIIASGFGDVLLACSSIMMQLLMIFSYFTDGFAYAGEALSGRFIGARDPLMLKRTVRYVFIWSMSIAVLFIGIYALTGRPMIQLFTSDGNVVEAGTRFLPWLMIMPPLGCAAFTWDGIYLGATAASSLFQSMALAMLGFFGVWFAWSWAGGASQSGDICLHVLLAAYFAHLAARTIWLSLRYRRAILSCVS